MKRFQPFVIIVLAALVACALLAAPALALTTAARSGSYAGTDVSELAIPGDSNAHSALLAANVTSDKAGSYLRVFWSSDSVDTTVDAASTSTTLNVTATTGFGASDLVAIQTAGGSVIERVVASVVSGVSLELDVALPTTHGNVGDAVYKMGDSATDSDAAFPVGAATVEKTNALGVFVGPRGSPLLLLMDSTTAGNFNYITWDFID